MYSNDHTGESARVARCAHNKRATLDPKVFADLWTERPPARLTGALTPPPSIDERLIVRRGRWSGRIRPQPDGPDTPAYTYGSERVDHCGGSQPGSQRND
jgi:hypothetical protein